MPFFDLFHRDRHVGQVLAASSREALGSRVARDLGADESRWAELHPTRSRAGELAEAEDRLGEALGRGFGLSESGIAEAVAGRDRLDGRARGRAVSTSEPTADEAAAQREERLRDRKASRDRAIDAQFRGRTAGERAKTAATLADVGFDPEYALRVAGLPPQGPARAASSAAASTSTESARGSGAEAVPLVERRIDAALARAFRR